MSNGYLPVNNGLIISTNQSPIPVYSTTNEPTLQPPVYAATNEPGLDHIDLDQAYNEHQTFNLRDPRFVQQFTGHLTGSPPISAWFSESFSVVRNNVWGFVVWALVYFLLSITQFVPNIVSRSSPLGSITQIIISISSIICALLMFTWYAVGLRYAFKCLKETNNYVASDFSSQFGELLSVIKDTLASFQTIIIQYILLSILISLGTCVGILLLIIPGVWFMVAFGLSGGIFIEHQGQLLSGISDSMRLSKNIVGQNWCGYFALFLLLGLCSIFIVGIPFALVVYAIAIRETVGFRQ